MAATQSSDGTPDQLATRLEGLLGAARGASEAGPLGRPRFWPTPSGVEVAAVLAETGPSDRVLVDAWRKQRRNRPTPLLLLVDSPNGLHAIGPEGVRPDPVSVEETLVDELGFLNDRGPLEEAVQQLQAAVTEHQVRAGSMPGIRPAGLFTPHFLFTRLPRTLVWESLEDEAPETVPAEWRPFLDQLGYELESLDEGFLARADGEAIAVVRAEGAPGALDTPLSGLDDLPFRRLGELMREHRLENGLLVAGPVVRLFATERPPSRLPDRFLELRLDRLEQGEHPYLAILAPAILGQESGIKRLLTEAHRYGAELRDGLEAQIRDQALPVLVAGLIEGIEPERLSDPEIRSEIMDAAFLLLFRLVFLLYCESADYLPVRSPRYQPHSLSGLCEEARRDWPDGYDSGADGLWRGVGALFSAVRTRNLSWGVPAYDGSLFATDLLAGAERIEEARITDEHLGPPLVALGFDLSEDDRESPGVDWAGLGVAHIGSIYESLLQLRLSYATEDLAYDEENDRYLIARSGDEIAQSAGSVFLQTERGGRKAGGVYYTQELFVDHLVEGAIGPVLTDHLDRVRTEASGDPEAATAMLLDFKVCDPAMGSGHFLVGALDYLASEIGAFLRETPLPAMDRRLEELRSSAESGEAMPPSEREILRRLLVKHCIYGVDRSAMAVELAKVSLWLASFVPGLPLSVLDANLVCGDSLVGVDRSTRVLEPLGVLGEVIEPALMEATEAAVRAAQRADLSLAEVEESSEAVEEARRAARRVKRAYDAITTRGFDRSLAHAVLDSAHLSAVLAGDLGEDDLPMEFQEVEALAEAQAFLHWPLAFPDVFSRENPGFDGVVGNPPWNEVTVERPGFFIQHDPGLGSVRNASERDRRIAAVIARFPNLEQEYQRAVDEAQRMRNFVRSTEGDYELQGRGDLDLYELFLERYGSILRDSGGLGVVLPRAAFYTDGTVELRRWAFEHLDFGSLDFLLNRRRWAFPIHPQLTIALVTARRVGPDESRQINLSGPHEDRQHFEDRVQVPIRRSALARWTRSSDGGEPSWEVPLLRSEEARDLWDRLMDLPRFDQGRAGEWRAFAATDFHVTNDRVYIRDHGDWEVWTGGTFEQFTPWFGELAGRCDSEEGCERLESKRQRSRVWREHWPDALEEPEALPPRTFRIAFRDVTNRTNSQTLIACLVPPRTFLTNKAPYLVMPAGGALAQAYLLGVLNSLAFNWQARRMVEISLNYFILNMLRLPDQPLGENLAREIADLAGQLNATDDRYVPWAAELGVELAHGDDEQRLAVRAELEARVARAYGLGLHDMELIFSDFTERALSPELRAAVRAAL